MSIFAGRRGAAILLVACGGLLAGCSGQSSQSVTAPGASQGAVALRFANGSGSAGGIDTGSGETPSWHCPLPGSGVTQLSITFDTIRLFPAESDDEDCGAPHDTAAYVEFLTGPITVDATALADSLDAFLGSVVVPAGSYSHLALHISAATAVTESGETVNVVPACGDSLLVIRSRFTVVEGEAITIRIFIDLDRSVHEMPPGSGNFVLTPFFIADERGPENPGHHYGHEAEHHQQHGWGWWGWGWGCHCDGDDDHGEGEGDHD